MGLELDRRRTLGVCAVALRTMGVNRRPLGLGSGQFRAVADLCTGTRRLSRPAGLGLYVSGAVGPQIAWFPLAPREVYWPSYRADPSYTRALNRPNVANIEGIQFARNAWPPAQDANAQFANRRFATVVPQRVFVSGSSVDPAAVHVPPAVLEHAAVTMRLPQIRPIQTQPVSGPAAFGARDASGRVAGGSLGYGSTVGPAPGPQGGRPRLAPQILAPRHSAAAQEMPAVRSGGSWPPATPRAPSGPALSHQQAAYGAAASLPSGSANHTFSQRW